MKVIYLASGHAVLSLSNVVYQDKFIRRDLAGCMLEVDLNDYDIIVASPPCNYWSRANYRRDSSLYSLETKDLLPNILKKCISLNKPFIVENVLNYNLMKKKGIFDLLSGCNVSIIKHGRHIYFTNVFFVPSNVPQVVDNVQNKSKKQRQGGDNVNAVFEEFLKYCLEKVLVDL